MRCLGAPRDALYIPVLERLHHAAICLGCEGVMTCFRLFRALLWCVRIFVLERGFTLLATLVLSRPCTGVQPYVEHIAILGGDDDLAVEFYMGRATGELVSAYRSSPVDFCHGSSKGDQFYVFFFINSHCRRRTRIQ